MARFAIVEAYEAARQFDTYKRASEADPDAPPLQVADGNEYRTVRNMRHDVLRRQVLIEYEDGGAAAVPSVSYLLLTGPDDGRA